MKLNSFIIYSIVSFWCLEVIAQEQVIQIPGSEVSFTMILIEGGDIGGNDQAIQLDSFWIGQKEVTFDEYLLFQDLEFDSDQTASEIPYKADAISRPTPQYQDYTFGMGRHGGFPAVSMTQQAALRYCQWLYQKTGVFYRLPTEAEWEYACAKGNSDKSDPEVLEAYAWYFENSFEKYQKTATKKANDLGVFDMLGNVAEWTSDHYLPYEDYQKFLAESENNNSWIAPSMRHPRTVKGGSYDDNAEDCTCQSRLKSRTKWQARDPQIPKSEWWNPDSPFVGFRLVSPVKQPTPEAVESYFKKAIVY